MSPTKAIPSSTCVDGCNWTRLITLPEDSNSSTAESLVAASGLAAAILMMTAGVTDPASLQPSLIPLEWPRLAPLATIGILAAALPAWLAPPVRTPTDVTMAHAASTNPLTPVVRTEAGTRASG